MMKIENGLMARLLKPYLRDVSIFLTGSLLTSGFDGISIGLLIPMLQSMQGNLAGETAPFWIQGVHQLLQRFPGHALLPAVGLVAVSVVLKNIFLGMTFQKGVLLSNRVTADCRICIMERLFSSGLAYHHQSRSGELLDKTINHTQWLREWLMSAVQLVVFATMFLVLMGLLFMLSWPLTVLVLHVGALVMGAMAIYLKRLPGLGETAEKTSRHLTHTIQENIGAIFLIQSQNRESAQRSVVSRAVHAAMHANNRLSIRSYWVQPLNEILGLGAIALLFLFSTSLLPPAWQLPLPQLLPFLYILIRLVQTLKILNDSRAVIRARGPYIAGIDALLKQEDKSMIVDGHRPYPGLKREIVFDDVSFAYVQGRPVLENLSFSVPAGSTTAIVGRSGCGKSTLTHLLLRLYDPQQGRILIDGQPLTVFQRPSYLARIGVVGQDPFFFNSSVKANIAFSVEPEVCDQRIIDAAKQAGAHGFIEKLPEGYNTPLGDRGVTLSGGQRQRIALARALLKKPELLILDEATSALDNLTEQQIHDTLFRLKGGLTIIIVAHRPDTVKQADRIVVLKAGGVVESGPPAELLALGREYFSLMKRKDGKRQCTSP